jgi:large subunit ribosomal protein L19
MDLIQHFTEQSLKKNAPQLRPGDTVRVHQRIREGNKERIQIFEGVVISVRGGKMINSSFVVRRIASGVGVEKTFPLHSPNVVKVERLKSSQVNQARLFYLRTRFGRNSRMNRELRSLEGWEEGQGDVAESAEALTESNQKEETPVNEAQTAEEAAESGPAETKEIATETTEESPESESTEPQTKTEA